MTVYRHRAKHLSKRHCLLGITANRNMLKNMCSLYNYIKRVKNKKSK